jgi:hypothetical protein
MSKNNLWAVLDVREEARDLAKKRAKLEKKKIGAWLSDLILGKSNLYTNSNQMGDCQDLIPIIDDLSKEMDEIKLGLKVIYDELNELNHSIQSIQVSPKKDSPPKHKFFGKFLG